MLSSTARGLLCRDRRVLLRDPNRFQPEEGLQESQELPGNHVQGKRQRGLVLPPSGLGLLCGQAGQLRFRPPDLREHSRQGQEAGQRVDPGQNVQALVRAAGVLS